LLVGKIGKEIDSRPIFTLIRLAQSAAGRHRWTFPAAAPYGNGDAAGERLARWAEGWSGGKMVGQRAALATRAAPFAGRTDAPSGHALRRRRWGAEKHAGRRPRGSPSEGHRPGHRVAGERESMPPFSITLRPNGPTGCTSPSGTPGPLGRKREWRKNGGAVTRAAPFAGRTNAPSGHARRRWRWGADKRAGRRPRRSPSEGQRPGHRVAGERESMSPFSITLRPNGPTIPMPLRQSPPGATAGKVRQCPLRIKWRAWNGVPDDGKRASAARRRQARLDFSSSGTLRK
jgi:hypothetical protein